MEREKFGSRLGFILISAGCAIGLGNVWRFPYMVGQSGGAAFILIYFAFLLLFGLPIMAMEFAVVVPASAVWSARLRRSSPRVPSGIGSAGSDWPATIS